MTLTLIPDAEKVTRAFLIDHEDVEALGTRVVGETPDSIEESWVRLTQIGGPGDPSSRVDHLVGFLLQLDCYASKAGLDGSPQKEAALIGRTVRAALREMPDADLDDAIVSGVRIDGDQRLPDTSLEPARERRILLCTIWMHTA